MLRRGLSARTERHLERGDELMELNRAAFERGQAAFERNEVAFKRNEAAFERNTQAFERLMATFDRHEQRFEKMAEESEDLRVYIRDMSRRNEVVFQNLMADHEKFMTKLLERDEGAERRAEQKTARILARLDEASEESKAHREALLALVDRLPPPAQAA
jgi:predicted  nucleic acid-binding Zn-ribbon protein